jgi:hypothetical protein
MLNFVKHGGHGDGISGRRLILACAGVSLLVLKWTGLRA